MFSVSSAGSGVIGCIWSLGTLALGTGGARLAAGGGVRKCLPSRSSPPTPAAAAPTAVTPAAVRNLRRSTVVVIVTSCGRRRARTARGAIGVDACTSHSSAATPAMPPMTAGATSLTWPPGLVIVTKAASRLNAARPATPGAAARRASTPIPTARTAMAAYMPSSSTVRPFVPKCCTATFFRAAGIRSMNTLPMAAIGEAWDRTNPATRVETPIATAAARNPVTAPTASPRRPASRLRSWSACQRYGSTPTSGAASMGSASPGSV